MGGETLLSEYIKKIIPENARIELLFHQDFNGDKQREVVVGYRDEGVSIFSSFVLLYIYEENNLYQYKKVLATNQDGDTDSIYTAYGVYDGAYALDTTGNGLPELILALTMGNGHFVEPYIFSWKDNNISCWRANKDYPHGLMYPVDSNQDGAYEVVVEYSTYSEVEDILDGSEAGPHIRASFIYSWNGATYIRKPYQIFNPKYKIFNSTATFLYNIWQGNYKEAFKYVAIPLFIGLKALDKAAFDVFKSYAQEELRPVLIRNLKDHKLTYQGGVVTYSSFKGVYDNFYLELLPGLDRYKITKIRTVSSN